MGSYVLDIRPSEYNGHKLTVPLCYPVWRSIASVNLMLDKQEKSALSYRLFDVDLSDPEGQGHFSANPQERKGAEKQAVDVTEEQVAKAAEQPVKTTQDEHDEASAP